MNKNGEKVSSSSIEKALLLENIAAFKPPSRSKIGKLFTRKSTLRKEAAAAKAATSAAASRNKRRTASLARNEGLKHLEKSLSMLDKNPGAAIAKTRATVDAAIDRQNAADAEKVEIAAQWKAYNKQKDEQEYAALLARNKSIKEGWAYTAREKAKKKLMLQLYDLTPRGRAEARKRGENIDFILDDTEAGGGRRRKSNKRRKTNKRMRKSIRRK